MRTVLDASAGRLKEVSREWINVPDNWRRQSQFKLMIFQAMIKHEIDAKQSRLRFPSLPSEWRQIERVLKSKSRSRLGGEVHTRPEERQRLLLFGKALGRAIEELITIVSVSTFYRWCWDEKAGKKKPNPKGGQSKPREIRELVIEIAKTTGFGYTRIIGELRKLGIKGISDPHKTGEMLREDAGHFSFFARTLTNRIGSS